MKTGFVLLATPGGVRSVVRPSSTRPGCELITEAGDGALSALLMGRLYYRDTLLKRLRDHGPLDPCLSLGSSDGALALAMFRACGPAGLQRLEGDFSLAVADRRAGQLFAARDSMGGYPLFWIVQPHRIAVSTSLNTLVGMLPQPQLDPEYFADYLMATGPRQEGRTQSCAYRDVHRILPGETISISLMNGTIRRHSPSDPGLRPVVPDTNQFDEAAMQYGQVLREAVRERLRGVTMSHLSGGMDSTAVTLLAGAQVAAGAGRGPLHAVSLAYERLPKLSRERPYLEAALAGQQAIVAHRVAGDDLLNFDRFAEPPAHDEPYGGLWHIETELALLQVAEAAGVQTMLTGLGADEVLDTTPYFLADLLRQGRWMGAWGHSCRWAGARETSPWKILRPYGIAPWTALFRARWGLGWRTQSDLSRQNDWAVPPWIAHEFAQEHGLAERGRQNALQSLDCDHLIHTSMAQSAIRDRAGDFARGCLAARRGIHIAHPFLDPRVVSSGLGIRARWKTPPEQVKPVLATALADVLPAAVRKRPRKGNFDEVYYRGLSRHAPRLEQLIIAAEGEELGMLVGDELLQALRAAPFAAAGADQLQRLDAALSLLCWLSHRREWLHADIAEDRSLLDESTGAAFATGT